MSNTNTTKTVAPVSTGLANIFRKVLKDTCTEDVCVDRGSVAASVIAWHKSELPKYLRRNSTLVALMVTAAVEAGQLPGFANRRGRSGGIYKVAK